MLCVRAWLPAQRIGPLLGRQSVDFMHLRYSQRGPPGWLYQSVVFSYTCRCVFRTFKILSSHELPDAAVKHNIILRTFNVSNILDVANMNSDMKWDKVSLKWSMKDSQQRWLILRKIPPTFTHPDLNREWTINLHPASGVAWYQACPTEQADRSHRAGGEPLCVDVSVVLYHDSMVYDRTRKVLHRIKIW